MDEIIELFIPVPKPQSTKERLLIGLVGFLFRYSALMVMAVVWIGYDWFYAIAFGLVAYLIQSIVISKITHEVVPFRQWEHRYSSFELAAWVVLRYRISDE